MDKKLLYSLPVLFLTACADNSEKYRDISHLELPPTLAVEHIGGATADPATIAPKAKAEKSEDAASQSSPNSDLENLILIVGGEEKPRLQMKTRFERAWDLVNNALRSAEIEVVDRNRDQGVFRVRYVAGEGKGRGFMSSITSFFSDKFEDIEYTLTLDKDKKITEAKVEKVVNNAQEAGANQKEAFNKDDTASLVKLLHKTMIADLQK